MQSKQAGVARQRACHSLHIISLHHPRIENNVDCTYTTIILQWCVGVACLPQRQTRIPMQFLGPSCTHTETSGCCPSASARFPWFQSYMRGYLKNYTGVYNICMYQYSSSSVHRWQMKGTSAINTYLPIRQCCPSLKGGSGSSTFFGMPVLGEILFFFTRCFY